MHLRETQVYDDIIPVELQDKFHDLVVQQPWYFVKDMSYANFEQKYPSFGFNTVFKHPKDGVISPLYEAVSVPIANALIERSGIEVKDIFFNRAFLQVPLDSKFVKDNNGVHVDIAEPHYAAVYYMNDSDGDTIVYEQNVHDTPFGSKNVDLTVHKRVTPKKGRIVLFDGARYHCSTQPRDKYRCIVNFVLI